MIDVLPPGVVLPLIQCEGDPPTLRMGCDVARYGTDHNVLWIRHANWVIACDRWNGLDSYESAMHIARLVQHYEHLGWIVEWVAIDVIGVGAGVVDALIHCGERFHELVRPINVARRSLQPERFRNVRAELAWTLRGRFRSYTVRFMGQDAFGDRGIPEHLLDRLEEQCASIHYRSDERLGSGVLVESKEEYKNRMDGKSPDEFDALAMVFNDDMAGCEKKGRPWGGGTVTSR